MSEDTEQDGPAAGDLVGNVAQAIAAADAQMDLIYVSRDDVKAICDLFNAIDRKYGWDVRDQTYRKLISDEFVDAFYRVAKFVNGIGGAADADRGFNSLKWHMVTRHWDAYSPHAEAALDATYKHYGRRALAAPAGACSPRPRAGRAKG